MDANDPSTAFILATFKPQGFTGLIIDTVQGRRGYSYCRHLQAEGAGGLASRYRGTADTLSINWFTDQSLPPFVVSDYYDKH